MGSRSLKYSIGYLDDTNKRFLYIHDIRYNNEYDQLDWMAKYSLEGACRFSLRYCRHLAKMLPPNNLKRPLNYRIFINENISNFI